MPEKPILFSGPMVRAILDGRKTETRRVIKPQPEFSEPQTAWMDGEGHSGSGWYCYNIEYPDEGSEFYRCPYGSPGDTIWVRETHSIESNLGIDSSTTYSPPFDDGRPIRWGESEEERYWEQCHYRATDPPPEICCESLKCRQCAENDYGPHWRPSIHMPRWASRITLRVTDVRVEMLQEITEAGCMAEGLAPMCNHDTEEDLRMAFTVLWDSIGAKRGHSWESNPWVWVVTFEATNA